MKTKNDSTYLLEFRKNIYSQFGEDGILNYIFNKLPKKKVNWSVEFGAWDGKFASNTCAFVKNKHWNGIYIEADSERFKDLLKNHGNNPRAHCISAFIELKGKYKLDNILNTVKDLPSEFDLLSIDIDSCDYYVWKSLKTHSPVVVVIEFNPTIPPDYEYIQPESFEFHDEHSLRSVTELGKQKGYELICVTDINAIFIKKEYFHLFKISDNSPKTLFAPFEGKYLTRLWQGGDGTLHLIGCKKLLWHNLIISENQIQVLPKYLRFFPGSTQPFLETFKRLYYHFPIISKVLNRVFS